MTQSSKSPSASPRAAGDSRAPISIACRRAASPDAAPRQARLRQSRARLRRLRRRRQARPATPAVKPNIAIVTAYNDMLSAHQPLSDYPAMIKRAAREAGRRGPVRRRRAGHVRRRHPGPAGHGAVAVQPRRHRHGDRGRADARHVRRRAVSGRLRQDRAGPADRRAGLRPSAGDLRAGRADAAAASPTTRRRASASSMPRARSAARSCWRPRPRPITRPAPAPSTAPPTATRC